MTLSIADPASSPAEGLRPENSLLGMIESKPLPVVCEKVSYTYKGKIQANREINLELNPGELFCLLGPNGAGKTTLIRQITADLKPSAGRILIFGQDARRNPMATKARLGVIPQGASLFEGLTVEQHLVYFGPLKQLTRQQTTIAVELMLKECQLESLRERYVGQLSGGQKRKVLIALALMANPDILILDEPTVGLDPVARRSVWETIREQRQRGKTILLTTHYLVEAEELADRVGFLNEGELQHVGTLAHLYSQVSKSVRVTKLNEETGLPLEHSYFDTLADAQNFIRERNLRAYSVGRVSLEDIYLRLVGKPLAPGAPE